MAQEGPGSGSQRQQKPASVPRLTYVSSGGMRHIEYSLPAAPAAGLGSSLPGAWSADSYARASEQAALGDALVGNERYAEALEHYREAVRLRVGVARYHHSLAGAAWKAHRLDLVEENLLEALRLDAAEARIHDSLCQWYLQTNGLSRALEHLAMALKVAPHDPNIAVTRAVALEAGGDVEAAWAQCNDLIGAGVRDPRLVSLYGRLAGRFGQERPALALVEQMLAAPRPTGSLRYVAAALLERLGRYDDAFEQARLANEARSEGYRPGEQTEAVDRRIAYYTPRKLLTLPRASHGNRRPVFIVGMPRSGTTLVEQILASHAQVYGAGELPMLIRLGHSVVKREREKYPDCLDLLSVRMADRLAAEYLSHIEALDPAATYVTDKMPFNFMYLGMIALLFPDCHVIHCTRDPLDTCLSCYMTDLSVGNRFAHDLKRVGTFYRDYRRLMSHWKNVLNFPMLEVSYEQVVSDVETQTRRMLEFLDLPFDERCLQFHQNARYVSTASKEQVRRPIYSSSVGRWRNYRRHLEPLMKALAEDCTCDS